MVELQDEEYMNRLRKEYPDIYEINAVVRNPVTSRTMRRSVFKRRLRASGVRPRTRFSAAEAVALDLKLADLSGAMRVDSALIRYGNEDREVLRKSAHGRIEEWVMVPGEAEIVD